MIKLEKTDNYLFIDLIGANNYSVQYMSLSLSDAEELLTKLQQVMNETPYTKLLEQV